MTDPQPDTRWNGEPCLATRVTAVVVDSGQFPQYWARHLVGTTRRAVQVCYGGKVFYIDDEDGSGWNKVTHGGGPFWPSSTLTVAPRTVRLRNASTTPPAGQQAPARVSGKPADDTEYEELRVQWLAVHGDGQQAHEVEPLAPDEEPDFPVDGGHRRIWFWPRQSGKRAAMRAAAAAVPETGTCDASTDGLAGATPLGPCILRYRHDGPVHKDASGATWWPRPAPDPDWTCPGCAATTRYSKRHVHQLADRGAAITRVRRLHRPVDHHGQTICAHCSGHDAESTPTTPVPYAACQTLAALAHPKDQT